MKKLKDKLEAAKKKLKDKYDGNGHDLEIEINSHKRTKDKLTEAEKELVILRRKVAEFDSAERKRAHDLDLIYARAELNENAASARQHMKDSSAQLQSALRAKNNSEKVTQIIRARNAGLGPARAGFQRDMIETNTNPPPPPPYYYSTPSASPAPTHTFYHTQPPAYPHYHRYHHHLQQPNYHFHDYQQRQQYYPPTEPPQQPNYYHPEQYQQQRQQHPPTEPPQHPNNYHPEQFQPQQQYPPTEPPHQHPPTEPPHQQTYHHEQFQPQQNQQQRQHRQPVFDHPENRQSQPRPQHAEEQHQQYRPSSQQQQDHSGGQANASNLKESHLKRPATCELRNPSNIPHYNPSEHTTTPIPTHDEMPPPIIEFYMNNPSNIPHQQQQQHDHPREHSNYQQRSQSSPCRSEQGSADHQRLTQGLRDLQQAYRHEDLNAGDTDSEERFHEEFGFATTH